MTNAIDMTDADTRKRVILVTVISALSLEIGTGMKASRGRSPMQVMKQDFGFKGRMKVNAMQTAIDLLQEIDPGYQVSPRIQKQLDTI